MGKRKKDREAEILRERRISLGLTQGQVAAEAGMELQTYQRYEYGKLRLSGATMKTGLRICAALELDPFETVFENGRDMAGVGKKSRRFEMKTVKEHLKAVDRQRLLDCLLFRLLSDPLQLLEMKDCTVQEIRDRYSRYMNAFIDRLLVTEAERSDSHLFYLYIDFKTGETLDLIRLKEVTEDIEASGYDFSSMELPAVCSCRERPQAPRLRQ